MKFALNLPIRFKIDTSKNSKLRSKILLKKLFIKYFSKKLIFKKQGFSGFPNEMASYLGKYTKYEIFKKLKSDCQKIPFKNFNKKETWKIINSEFFIRSYNAKIYK